jgi:hypothetical protein
MQRVLTAGIQNGLKVPEELTRMERQYNENYEMPVKELGRKEAEARKNFDTLTPGI